MSFLATLLLMPLAALRATATDGAAGPAATNRVYRYKNSTEELRDKFSDDQMRRAEQELKAIQAVNDKGPWKADWASLDKHPLPEWYHDAKFGIAINWGLYSVPAWDKNRTDRTQRYPDGYPSWMYDDPAHIAHQAETFGAGSQYDDFFRQFTTDNYDPEKLAAMIADVGARYILPFCKHCDAIAWWDSQWTRRSFAQMGPKQDLLTPLFKAARKNKLKVAAYCPVEEYAYPVLAPDGKIMLREWTLADAPTVTLTPLSDANRHRVSGCVPVHNFFDQYMTPLVKEVIDRFDVDMLWLDGDWSDSCEVTRGHELAAYLYNHAEGRKEVCINDRMGQTRMQHGDFTTSEFHTYQSFTKYWEEIRGISASYAFNQDDNETTLLTRAGLVHMLINTVAKNGNLLLILGPDRTGKIPDLQIDRVQALGRWLKVNGEAIYATRFLPPYEVGTVAYTRSKDWQYAYAICKAWPGKTLKLTGVRAATDSVITMLGYKEPLSWRQDEKGLDINIPQKLQDYFHRPCEHAWAIRIPLQPRTIISRKPLTGPVKIESFGICDHIVYTVDGSEPTPSSTVYAEPFVLPGNATVTVKACCVRAGKLVSQPMTATYPLNLPVPSKPDVALDTLEPVSFKTGWQAQGVKTWRNVNCHGQALTVGGEKFQHGVGMHANGEAVFPVKPEYKRFVCRVGVDDAAGLRGSIIVKLFLDDKLLRQTPVLGGGDGLWNINEKLEAATDKSVLRIVIEDAGDGIDGDNADLVDAGCLVQDK